MVSFFSPEFDKIVMIICKKEANFWVISLNLGDFLQKSAKKNSLWKKCKKHFKIAYVFANIKTSERKFCSREAKK